MGKFILVLDIIIAVVLIFIFIYKKLTDKYVSRYTFQLVFGKKVLENLAQCKKI